MSKDGSVGELEVAKTAARAGGAVIARYFGQGIAMRSKSDCDLVSDADIESEQAIVQVIRQAYPQHAILAEESHHANVRDAEYLWVVDPLDGTTNFAHGIPHIAVSIALYVRGQPKIGVIYNPLREDWYTAVRGRGATVNGQPASVSDSQSLTQALIGVGFYYDRGAMMEATLATIRDLFGQQIHGIRRFGTAALDLCMVGTGMYGAYFEYQLSAWDYAAGRLFVEEAGGTVTRCDGSPLQLDKCSVLATNGRLHQTMLGYTNRHW